MLQPDEQILGVAGSDKLVELCLKAVLSRFCDVWIRKTIRNVTTLVRVFITSCQVSEK
jgi:hypothetical protein